MALNKSRIVIITVALIALILSFAVVFSIGYVPNAQTEDKPGKDTDMVEPPLSPGHQETVLKKDTPLEERKPAVGVFESSVEDAPLGQLRWTPIKAKKEEPEEKLSTFEKEGKVIKPEMKDGSALR